MLGIWINTTWLWPRKKEKKLEWGVDTFYIIRVVNHLWSASINIPIVDSDSSQSAPPKSSQQSRHNQQVTIDEHHIMINALMSADIISMFMKLMPMSMWIQKSGYTPSNLTPVYQISYRALRNQIPQNRVPQNLYFFVSNLNERDRTNIWLFHIQSREKSHGEILCHFIRLIFAVY